MRILALALNKDITGIAYINTKEITPRYISGVWDIKPKRKTKKSEGEPEYIRLVNLWNQLRILPFEPNMVVIEEKKDNDLTAIVKLYAGLHNTAFYACTEQKLKDFIKQKNLPNKAENKAVILLHWACQFYS